MLESGSLGYPWLLNPVVSQNFREPFIVKTPPLTTAIEPFIKNPPRLRVKLLQTVIIAYHSIVIVITAKLRIQKTKQLLQTKIPALTTPFREVFQAPPEPLTGCSPLNCIFPFAANSPAKLKAQKLKESSFLFSVPREPYYLRLVL